MILVLFDIDGTLVNAHGLGRRTIERSLSEVSGRAVSADGVPFAGRTDPGIATDMLLAAGVPPREVPELLAAGFERYTALINTSASPEQVLALPGVRGVLDTLGGDEGVCLGLLTGNLEASAHAKLRAAGLDHYFRMGAFGSDHADRYALPRVALERARTLLGAELPAGSAVVVGDTVHDVGCGRQAGMRTVAVCTGPVAESELRLAGPDLFLPDLRDPAPLYAFLGLNRSTRESAF